MDRNRFLPEKKGVFVVAEIGINFSMGSPTRDLCMAGEMIDLAAEAGVDAVKFQSFRAHRYYAYSDKKIMHFDGSIVLLGDLLKDTELRPEFLPKLARRAQENGVQFMSTAFSPEDLALVDPHVAVHKVASCEISHFPLLEAIARTRKPLILSTGAADISDIGQAVTCLRRRGARKICLMQCTAGYPAEPANMNLDCMRGLGVQFDLPFGLSDHSEHPVVAPVMAVASGVSVIEKHFTLDKRLPGPDHSFAVTPRELSDLVNSVRLAEKMLGAKDKKVGRDEIALRNFARRALHATRNIRKGDVLSLGVNFDVLRPGNRKAGAHPRDIAKLEGKRANRNISLGSGIRLDHGKRARPKKG